MTKTLIDPAAIGVELSWSFGDGDAEAVTMPRETLRVLLAKHGFAPELVGEMSEDLALRKAAHTVKGRSKTIVVQELRRPNKDTPRAYGVYRVVGHVGERGDDMIMGARVRCEGQHVLCLPPSGDACFADHDCQRVGSELARIANSLIHNVINWGISDVVVNIGRVLLGWISRRRNSGGVYFASTNDVTERFVALLQGIETESQTIAARPGEHNPDDHRFVPEIMEVYPKPLAMDMWKSSAKAQYEQQTQQLLNDLHKMQGKDGDKMRENTVATRAAECDRLISLAEGHRLFLESAVYGITAALAEIREGFQKRIDDNKDEAKAAFDAIDKAVPKRKRRRKKAAPTVKPTKLDLSKMSADDLFGQE